MMEIQEVPSEKELPGTQASSQVIRYIKEQRHDFMNHIQVIWGYLQLKKPDEAVKYINRINEEYDIYGYLFRIGSPELTLLLYNNIKNAHKLGLKVDFQNDIEYIEQINCSDYNCLMDNLNILFYEVVGKTAACGEKAIYIDLYEENEKLHISISNNSCDELYFKNDKCPVNTEPEIAKALEKLSSIGIDAAYCTDDSYIVLELVMEYTGRSV